MNQGCAFDDEESSTDESDQVRTKKRQRSVARFSIADESRKGPKKRVSKACDRCRRRKDKCDGVRPACSKCVAAERLCSYDPSTRKRGLPGGYIDSLRKQVATLTGEQRPSGDRHEIAQTWSENTLSEDIQQSYPMHIQGSCTPSQENLTMSSPVGREVVENGDLSHHISNQVNMPRISNLIPPPQSDRLLALYDMYTHCWFPIIPSHHLTRISHQYSSGKLRTAEEALLWAVFAIVDVQITSNSSAFDQESGFGQIYSRARGLIPTEEMDWETEHVQALLLLSLVNISRQKWKAANILVGQAVRTAIELGLDRPSSDSESSKRCIYFGCFILDTLVSARLRRSPHLRSADVVRIGIVDESHPEEWRYWTDWLKSGIDDSNRRISFALSTFNHLSRLMQVLNDFLCDEKSATKSLEDMQIWHYEGQDARDLNGLPVESSLLPHQYNLQIACIATQSILLSNSPREAQMPTTLQKQAQSWLNQYSNAFGNFELPTFGLFASLINTSVGSITGIEEVSIRVGMQQNLEQTQTAQSQPDKAHLSIQRSSANYANEEQGANLLWNAFGNSQISSNSLIPTDTLSSPNLRQILQSSSHSNRPFLDFTPPSSNSAEQLRCLIRSAETPCFRGLRQQMS